MGFLLVTVVTLNTVACFKRFSSGYKKLQSTHKSYIYNMNNKIYTTEAQLQADFWQYFWNHYEPHRHKMWAVPNDGIGQILSTKDAIRANILKATGLLSGVWDLHAYQSRQLYIIETKLPGNQLTVTRMVKSSNGKQRKVYGQKEWGEIMAAEGAIRLIYHNMIEGATVLKQIFGEPTIFQNNH